MIGTRVFPGFISLLSTPPSCCLHSHGSIGFAPCFSAPWTVLCWTLRYKSKQHIFSPSLYGAGIPWRGTGKSGRGLRKQNQYKCTALHEGWGEDGKLCLRKSVQGRWHLIWEIKKARKQFRWSMNKCQSPKKRMNFLVSTEYWRAQCGTQ